MATYAKKTKVPASQSQREIETTLRRYGARQFMSGWDEDADIAMVGFSVLCEDGQPRQVRLRLPIPKSDQAKRSAWRALALVVKAKLQAVESGISTIEREFMSDVVLPDGRTFSEWAAPQLTKAYSSGKMPKLLPGGDPCKTKP